MCAWSVDADALDIDSAELDLLCENGPVRSFLADNSRVLGVAGIKGQGKTYILKIRRRKSESKGIDCIPKNVLVDSLDSSFVNGVDGSILSYLCSYGLWVDLWKLSISVSIFLSKGVIDEKKVRIDRLGVTPALLKLVSSCKVDCAPTEILAKLLRASVQELREMIKSTYTCVKALDEVRYPIHVFVDRMDQAFAELYKSPDVEVALPRRARDESFWQYAQVSLAEAAYDIDSNGANHVKVYFSIRQEALYGMERLTKDKARNIAGFVSQLDYSYANLKEIYEKNIRSERSENLRNPGSDNLSVAFVGTDEVCVELPVSESEPAIERHTEPVFDYIYRHTMKRPQDLMHICRELSHSVRNLDNYAIREIVNRSSDGILNQYLAELAIFIDFDIDEMEHLKMLIPGDLLDAQLIRNICDKFNRDAVARRGCNGNCPNCDHSKPFTSLINIGLLGEVGEDLRGDTVQRFKAVGTASYANRGERIIDGRLYVLHPCLHNAVKAAREREGLNFYKAPHLVLGDGQPFDLGKDRNGYYEAASDALSKERVFVSSTINDLREERGAIREYLIGHGLYPVMSEEPEFDLRDGGAFGSHDLCIREALRCGNMIFVIGASYGGEYAGREYSDVAEEIMSVVSVFDKDGVFSRPSISLMEFYVMKKEGKRCHAFISSDVEGAIRDRSFWPSGNHVGVGCDERVKFEYQFINHLKDESGTVTGNWISAYSDMEDLIARLSRLTFL